MYIESTAIFLTAAAILNSASTSIGFGATGDWPQWRGPKRDGISTETGLLNEWPAKGPPLAWKASGLGRGYSSVSVVGNQIFTIGDGADSSFVHALNLADGKIQWSAKVGKTGGGDG